MHRTKLSIRLEIVAWVLLAVILIGALVYYNAIYKEPELYVYGTGEKCYPFEIMLFKSAGADGGTYAPKDSLNQVTVLNFWYSTCGPCLAELPHFNDAQIHYGDKIRVVAIHASDVDEEVDKQAFLDKYGYSDYVISFGLDTVAYDVYHHLGGDGTYPTTVILDKEGIIRFTRKGGISREDLFSAIDGILAA